MVNMNLEVRTSKVLVNSLDAFKKVIKGNLIVNFSVGIIDYEDDSEPNQKNVRIIDEEVDQNLV